MPPVFTQRHGTGESMVALQPLTPSRVVLQAPDSLGECRVHKVVIELLNRYFSIREAIRPRRIGENDGTVGAALV